MLRALLVPLLLNSFQSYAANDAVEVAVRAINSVGVELLAKTAEPGKNALLSPYSVQMGMGMAYAGASGTTRAEMLKALHYPKDEGIVHLGFSSLREALENICRVTASESDKMKQFGVASDPVILTSANRLFGQTGYEFRPQFMALTREVYHAPFEPVDFLKAPDAVTHQINDWISEQTRGRIPKLIPEGALDISNRLVLINAIYLKAPWMKKFSRDQTRPRPFHVAGKVLVDVPTMTMDEVRVIGYRPYVGFKVVAIPYAAGQLQFLVLLPDEPDGLDKLQARLDPAWLADWVGLPMPTINLSIPRFKLDPAPLALANQLEGLGMKTAFDRPPGSANFDRMAPRTMNGYLYLSKVFHKTFLTLDEDGTEAAAASGFAMRYGGDLSERPIPIEVRIDHPFLFAIQHRASGACLFIGRVNDPR